MKHYLHLTMWLIPGGILLYSGGLYSLIVFGLTLLMVLGLWIRKRRDNRVQVVVPETLTQEDQYLYVVKKLRSIKPERTQRHYLTKTNRILDTIRVITITLLLSSCSQLFYKPIQSGTMDMWVTVLTPDTTLCRKDRIQYSQETNSFGSTVQFSYRDSVDTIVGKFYRADQYSYQGESKGIHYLLTYPGYREKNLLFALQDSTRTIVVGFECYKP